jgi:hypothetical protein
MGLSIAARANWRSIERVGLGGLDDSEEASLEVVEDSSDSEEWIGSNEDNDKGSSDGDGEGGDDEGNGKGDGGNDKGDGDDKGDDGDGKANGIMLLA